MPSNMFSSNSRSSTETKTKTNYDDLVKKTKTVLFNKKRVFITYQGKSQQWLKKTELKNLMVKLGATVESILTKSVDFIVVIDCLNDKDKSPNLLPVIAKAKEYNIPFYKESLVYNAILYSFTQFKTVEKFDVFGYQRPYFIKEAKVEAPIANEEDEDEDVIYDLFGDNTSESKREDDEFSMYDLFGDNASSYSKKDDDDESIYSDCNLFGILDDLDLIDYQPSSSSSNVPTPTSSDNSQNSDINIGSKGIIYNEDNYDNLYSQIEFNEDQEIQDMLKMDTPYFNTKKTNVGHSFYLDDGRLKLIDLPLKLKKIEVTKGNMSFVDCKDKLYLWGKLTNNQVRKLNTGESTKFLEVSCNRNNIIAVDLDGGCWELDLKILKEQQQKIVHHQKNQQQLDSLLNCINLKFIHLPMTVKMISCGFSFVIGLTESGSILSWGTDNNMGQLGRVTIPHPSSLQKPHIIPNLPKAHYISSGNNHSMAIVEEKNHKDLYVYVWGSNNENQLGLQDKVVVKKPTKLWKRIRELKIVCNEDYSIVCDYSTIHALGAIPNEIDQCVEILKEKEWHTTGYELFKYKKSVGFYVTDAFLLGKFLIQNDRLDLLMHHIENTRHDLTDLLMLELLLISIKSHALDIFKYIYHSFIQEYKVLLNGHSHTTYLHECVEHKSHTILRYIIKNKICKVDAIDVTGNSALHESVLKNCTISLITLCEYGCDRNLKNLKGKTALHLATQNNNISISMLLLKNGAQAIIDSSMKNPLQYITDKDNKSLLQNIMFTNEVFLSYAHKDLEFVRKLRVGMETYSIRCWLDEYRLQAGCDWRAEITKGVSNAKIIIFTISETSSISLWCRKELKMARRLGKTIIAINYHDVPLDPVLKGLFDYEFHTPAPFSSLDPESIKLQFTNLAKIVKSTMNGTKPTKIDQTQKELEEKYSDRSIYISFSDVDYKLFKFIRTLFLNRGIPVVDRDFLFDNVQKDVQKVKVTNQSKVQQEQQKESSEYKQMIASSKKEKRLVSLYSFNQDLFNFEEKEIPIINSLETSSVSAAAPTPSFYNYFHDVKPKEDPFESIQPLKQPISKSILHLVIYPGELYVSEFMKEVEYAISEEKSVFVVTTNFSDRAKSNTLLKNQTWVELKYQEEDKFFDKILANYEVLDRTQTIQHKLMSELAK